MADWEWRRVSFGQSKTLIFAPTLPTTAVDYGGYHTYDLTRPLRRYEFEAVAAPASVVSAVQTNYETRGATFDITDSLGANYTGLIEQWDSQNIPGTNRHTITLTLVDPPAAP